jgi:hypothetical protein
MLCGAAVGHLGIGYCVVKNSMVGSIQHSSEISTVAMRSPQPNDDMLMLPTKQPTPPTQCAVPCNREAGACSAGQVQHS